MGQIDTQLARYIADEEGTVTLFSTLMMILIFVITGASVDIMYHESARVRLQSTLDRAVLAAADLDQQQEPTFVVTDYVAKAGLSEHLTSVTATPLGNDRTVSAEAGMNLSTFFMHMAGHPVLPVRVSAMAEERVANVEISLVLDISGSMRNNNRIENLRPAATTFVEKVMDEANQGVTTLNLVPFAGQVNPGDTMFNYLRGQRPKIKGNNGWGNGDQDAPGGSLCNNNAENADEALLDPSCTDGTATATATNDGFFPEWPQAISNIVVYFDTDGDDSYDRAHKIESFPETAPRDVDAFFEGAVAFMIANDNALYDADQFLGISIKGGTEKTQYFQVKGDSNGFGRDLGPTKNTGKIPGNTYAWNDIDYTLWAGAYVAPQADPEVVNVNMPSSCVEIYDLEFTNTALPESDVYVPHFQYWPTDTATMDWGWCPGKDTEIQYYSDDAAALTSFINNMRLHDGTGLQYGMKYALALLDPLTAPAVSNLISEGLVDPRFEGRPIAWHDPETEKFIVVMTDGEVTDQYRPVDDKAPINGIVDLQTQGGASYSVLSGQGNNLDNMHSQCQLARDNGVTVFMVAYETSDAVAAELSACASSESHFFHVQGDEIIETFDTIARQINNLRLVQ
ncbi:pilus assembly protein TadG-related protein [Sagittula sp. S175]|uniref:Tad domain-containing protein n=1 Tax=Sagittula sp. S175 TaxID=3415129 RepID=UPI003C79C3AB